MTWKVGTSGFAYGAWSGSFYPEDLPDADRLAYYASRLGAVEINNTFYRMPTRSLLEGWDDQTPDDFTFVLKASRKITHFKKLTDCDDAMEYLVDVSRALGEKLGPTLIQLPPYLKKDVELLRDFLALVPDDFPAAMEFRSSSWFDDEVYAALEEAAVALVASDRDGRPEPPVVRTARHGYARLRRSDYDDEALEGWAERLAEPGWDVVYAFFKHEESGAGPRFAERFRELVPDS